MSKLKTKRKPRWQFLWQYADVWPRKPPKERFYYAPTIEAACDKMLRWIESRNFEVAIDYEARAEHVPYSSKNHEAKYPNIGQINHEIKRYVQ